MLYNNIFTILWYHMGVTTLFNTIIVIHLYFYTYCLEAIVFFFLMLALFIEFDVIAKQNC